MDKTLQQEYFADTTAISNSQLCNFVSYDKWGNRLVTSDIYEAYASGTIKFERTDPIIVGKIVDEYFEKGGEYFFNPEKIAEKYPAVSRRTGKNENEITKTMEADYKRMIEWGTTFESLQSFIEKEDTKSQVILEQDLEIVDENGEIHTVKIKGLPDYINSKEKTIVDLKTTGNMSMIIEDLQFKGKPNIYARYIRQLAFYNKMAGGDYNGAIALVSTKGILWIEVPNIILLKAWEKVEEDILELIKFKKNPTEFNASIFDLDKLDEEEDLFI